MSRRSTGGTQPRLVEDGRGYRTPLQDLASEDIPALLRREVAALPRRPHYPPRKPRYSRSPRTARHASFADTGHPPDTSGSIRLLQLLILAAVLSVIMFTLLAKLGRIISPDLEPIATGVSPYGPRVLLTFAMYAFTGLAAGAGVSYYMLRQSQD